MINPVITQIIRSRCGGRVERCHTIPHQGSYSNAAHSWGVAMLMWYLFPQDYPRLSIYCLTHDIGEGWTGDVPAPALWAVTGMRESFSALEGELQEMAGVPREDSLSDEDMRKLKACDRLELYIWCREQLLRGNQFVKDCILALEVYFAENPLPYPAAVVYSELQRMDDTLLLPQQQGIIQSLVELGIVRDARK